MKDFLGVVDRHRFTVAWLVGLTYLTCLLAVVRST